MSITDDVIAAATIVDEPIRAELFGVERLEEHAASLAAAPRSAFALQGSGFRDFTRIAASDPELWADILATNAKALAAPLAASAAALAQLTRAIEAGDLETLHRLLVGASAALATANEAARSGGQAGNFVAPAATPKE